MQYLYVWSFTQIVLESLPVSSSGNVVVVLHLLQNYLQTSLFSIEALDFDFLLHGPTVLIVLWYFRDVWFPYSVDYKRYYKDIFLLGMYCIWADSITAVWYGIFKAIGTTWWPLSFGFLITACSLLSLKKYGAMSKSKQCFLSLYDVSVLGMVQGVALLPGLSRFGLTFVAARYLGYSPEYSFRYSFLLQMPLIGAAFLKGCYSFYLFEYKSELLHPLFLAVILIATVVSYGMLYFAGRVIAQGKAYLFGWYVLFLALLTAVIGR